MIVRPWQSEAAEGEAEEPAAPAAPRLREHASPIGQIVGQNLLDAAVRELQGDLANLQAEQERSLGEIGGVLTQISQELGAVRTQLGEMSETASATQGGAAASDSQVEQELDTARERVSRIERQVALLVRGLDAADALRSQSEVHTRAISRLTDLVADDSRRLENLDQSSEIEELALTTERRLAALERASFAQRPAELAAIQQAQTDLTQVVTTLQQAQTRHDRQLRAGRGLYLMSLTPGLAALIWLAGQALGLIT